MLQALLDRKKFSIRRFQDKHDQWKEDEKEHVAYIKEDDEALLRKSARDAGDPQYVTLDIPYSYGLMMAAVSYWSSVFLARNPVFQYQAAHGSTPSSEQRVEALINYQYRMGRMLPHLFVWLNDCPKFGVGIIGEYWDRQKVRAAQIVEEPQTLLGVPVPGKPKKMKKIVEIPGYEGNKLFNVRPYDFLPDPRVSLMNFQEGEFCGRLVEPSWMDLVRGAKTDIYFNIEAWQRIADSSGDNPDKDMGAEGYGNIELPDPSTDGWVGGEIPNTEYGKGFEMFVRLVPRDWGLGESSDLEMWVFTVLSDEIIVEARPVGALHDQFPFSVIEYEIDGHYLHKRSLYEIAQPLQDTISWLVNSHFFNTRKAMNNMFIADPSRVQMSDFRDPQSGLLIRLKPSAYGTPIGDVISQLPVVDVTKQHLSDAGGIGDLMEKILGINEQMAGGGRGKSSRATATEIRSENLFSTSRLKTHAEFMAATGFGPLAQRMLQNTQQWYDRVQEYRIAGDLLPGQETSVIVDPESIVGQFDYEPVDGTLPIDRFAMANLWKELLSVMLKSPELGMEYDLGKIFAYTAQLAGARNVAKFKIQLRPDQMLAQQAQAGNVVPLDAVKSAGPGNPVTQAAEPERTEGGITRANEPRQISGVGPTS